MQSWPERVAISFAAFWLGVITDHGYRHYGCRKVRQILGMEEH